MDDKTYLAIDLKSYYASVECVEKGYDPLDTNLIVADPSRTEKTICLAVSPSLKAMGIPGRPRLFEVVQKVKSINAERKRLNGGKEFTGRSYSAKELQRNCNLSVDYVVATPRMAKYVEISTKIYKIYLKYISPEDIHVYSIDEVFIDITPYLKLYGFTPVKMAEFLLKAVLDETGITATAGIGTNLYLAKIAMDIVAKHATPNEDGARIAELNEFTYRTLLWEHQPLTDFWRIGRGYADKLRQMGIYTMGDIARFSETNENVLFKAFGINAGPLIDHAWGIEPCTIKDIKSYVPENNSLSGGQVLQRPYKHDEAGIIIREMAEQLALDLTSKGLVCKQVILYIGYDVENLKDEKIKKNFCGEIKTDRYGRKVPEHGHGIVNFDKFTSSARLITDAATEIFESKCDSNLLIRRINIVAGLVIPESKIPKETENVQLNLFSDFGEEKERKKAEKQSLEKEIDRQKAVVDLKERFGKNAVLKGISLLDSATMKERNSQIGGHKA